MMRLKSWILEIHRRSLWQVLAVYLAGSWVSLQVVDALTRTAGLPDWVPAFSLVLLMIGFPIVMATAVVQEGGPSSNPPDVRARAESDASDAADAPSPTDPPPAGDAALRASAGPVGASAGAATAPDSSGGTAGVAEAAPARTPLLARHLTWNRALLGGVLGFALLGLSVSGYFVMRVAGIGPVASLVAQGMIGEGESVILADFRNATNDPLLGAVVTEALRIDLASSPALSLVEPTQIRETLQRMGRSGDEPFTAEVAREVALRDGVKAFLEGEVGSAGTGYILSATLRMAEGGGTLATFRRTARDPAAVIDAIDRLSQDVREKTGESLRSIRRGGALSQVTTSSLDALQKYTEGDRVLARGDEARGLALLEEAVALDPEFAMAWRKLAMVLQNQGLQQDRARDAIERAYRYRERLTRKERYLAEATYHANLTGDSEARVRAYENALRIDPLEPIALNNLANFYNGAGRHDLAEELYRRSIEEAQPASVGFRNLITNQILQGKFEGARAVLERYRGEFPDDPRIAENAFWVEYFSGDLDSAQRELDVVLADRELPTLRRRVTMRLQAELAAARGRLSEARVGLEETASFAGREIGPSAEHFDRLVRAAVEHHVALDTARALELLAEAEALPLLTTLPPWERNRDMAIFLLLDFGDHPGGLRELERLEEETPAARVTPNVRALWDFQEFWATEGKDEPEALLRELDRFQLLSECRACYEELRPMILERTGRSAEALEALKRFAARPLPNFEKAMVSLPHTLEEIGRLGEMLGDTAAALDASRRFVELFSEADPELQPRVEVARARIAALGGR